MGAVKRFLEFLVIGSFSLVIAACYGMPIETAYRLVQVRCSGGQAIPGLELTFPSEDDLVEEGRFMRYRDVSNDGGVFYLEEESIPFDRQIRIRDIDGAENGGEFEEKTLSLAEYGRDIQLTMKRLADSSAQNKPDQSE